MELSGQVSLIGQMTRPQSTGSFSGRAVEPIAGTDQIGAYQAPPRALTAHKVRAFRRMGA